MEDRATAKQRLMALSRLPVDFDIIYTNKLDEKISTVRRIGRALLFRMGYFPERNNENAQLIKKLSEKKYNILFIEKGLSIRPRSLIKAKQLNPQMQIISYTLDDVFNKNNSSVYYLKSIPLYNFHFTNKKFNVEELKNAGGNKVYYFRNAYSEDVHRPIVPSPQELLFYGADVSFIGTYEEERASFIRFIAQCGIKVKIWGWVKSAASTNMKHTNITVVDKYVYDDEYSKVVCSSKINLCFLRKENRDTETTRSVEIPACGGFMLAEKTVEHLELFDENTEAAFFSTKEELLEKIQYYLKNELQRKDIAANGLSRCLRSNYSYSNQLKNILFIITRDNAFSDN